AAPSSMQVYLGATLTISSGTYTARGTVLGGNLTLASGATFTQQIGTYLNFNGTAAQVINGTASSLTCYNLSVATPALSTAGSIATITVSNNFQNQSGNFTLPATFNV